MARLFYFIMWTAFVIVPYIGVFPKWLSVLFGSIHILITLASIALALTGTPLTGPFFIVIVAVPLYTTVLLFGIEIRNLVVGLLFELAELLVDRVDLRAHVVLRGATRGKQYQGDGHCGQCDKTLVPFDHLASQPASRVTPPSDLLSHRRPDESPRELPTCSGLRAAVLPSMCPSHRWSMSWGYGHWRKRRQTKLEQPVLDSI